MSSNPYNAQAPEHAEGQKSRRRSKGGKPLVLVVEDHENTLLQEVLIVALSGWAAPSFHAAALAAGCNECLDKPIDFKRLKGLITDLSDASFAAG